MQPDCSPRCHRRQEAKPDAEFLERNCDLTYAATSTLQVRKGKFAAGHETRFMSVHREDVGLRQNLQDVLILQRFERRPYIQMGIEQKQIERIAQRKACAPALARIDGPDARRTESAGGRGKRKSTGRAEKVDAEIEGFRPVDIRKADLQQNLP